ncbi:MAG: acetylglutamate kinase [Chthoniobacterales bacterium]|jgi:acetylglutamate kinase|nr:acetylglutamate kinase [Chthoniobacterales bacterium]
MSLPDAQVRAAVLAQALPFIQQFRGRTFVIKYGGSAMESDDAVGRLLRDVVFLEAVGVNPVLVHGGGKAISAKMREAGLTARFVNGLRVTDEASVRIVEDVLDREVNPRLVKAIDEFGGSARGFSGRQVLRAEKLPPVDDGKGGTEDIGFVGRVTGVETAELEKVLHEEHIPVVSPVALGPDGRTYNVNADEAAAAIAGALRAVKLIFLSDVPGIMRDREDAESLLPTVRADQVDALIRQKVLEGGMIPKVQGAVAALRRGVGKTHMIDGRLPHALFLALFTNERIGTEIVA